MCDPNFFSLNHKWGLYLRGYPCSRMLIRRDIACEVIPFIRTYPHFHCLLLQSTSAAGTWNIFGIRHRIVFLVVVILQNIPNAGTWNIYRVWHHFLYFYLYLSIYVYCWDLACLLGMASHFFQFSSFIEYVCCWDHESFMDMAKFFLRNFLLLTS